jgi:hypothetical protein
MTQPSMQQDPQPRVVTSIALSREEHRALKEIAAEQQRTVSAQVRYWISTTEKVAA